MNLPAGEPRNTWINPAHAIEAQRGYLFAWAPVAMAIGIGLYFGLRFEPDGAFYGYLAVIFAALVLVGRWVRPGWRPVFTAACLGLVGFGAAGARAHLVAEPVLGYRYYGAIEGRIVVIDRSGSDKVRLTLDQVVLERMSPARTPARVRVSLHGQQGFITPKPGLRVMTTGHLSPPQGPVEPGGFDFRRMAWFRGLGAVGYTRSPVLIAAPAELGSAGLLVHRTRMAISTAVQKAMPGETGAFAAAIMTGDRSGMGKDTLAALRGSNLAHLLAISGLHMGLLTGFIFAAMRYALVAIPWVGLRLPVKKTAAVVSLAVGWFYYLLSGGNVATERAFIMVSVMFVAVLFDRRAITLRAVAIAAIIVLSLRPETLTEPGFQMSFAATTALVAVFGWLRDWRGWRPPRMLRPVLAVVISSAVAGIATAPVAAAHFNRVADYGLVANLLSVPLMGSIVMPAAVLSAILAPFGLAWIGLAIMGPAIAWILGVAHWVANMDGAITPVIAPQGVVIPVLALGILWLILWRGRWRFAGVIPAITAFAIWSQAERPPVLISASGALMGVMTDQGRALSKPRGDGFTALSWLENDGDAVAQDVASERPGLTRAKDTLRIDLGGQSIVHLSGRSVETRIADACKTASLVVVAKKIDTAQPCLVFDALKLRKIGSVAIYSDQGSLRMEAAQDRIGKRLWAP